MSITIDVAQQLLPNLATVIVQLCSTAVLMFFLWKFLWKPARKYLADKAALTQKPLDDALQKQKEAEAKNQEADERLAKAASKAESMVKQGQDEGKKAKASLVAEGQKQVERMLDTAGKQIESDRARMQDNVHKEIVDVALAATEKLMKDSANSDKNKSVIEDFVKDVRNG